MSNRQTEEFRQIVQENNATLIKQLGEQSIQGDKDLLAQITRMINDRDAVLEDKLVQRINQGEKRMVEQISEQIKKEDYLLEQRINVNMKELRNNLKLEINENINSATVDINTKLNKLDHTHREITADLTTKLEIATKRDEVHHKEFTEAPISNRRYETPCYNKYSKNE